MQVHNVLGEARTVAPRSIASGGKLCGFMHLAYAHVPLHGPSPDVCPR